MQYMHVENYFQGEKIIIEEFEKGYTYRDVVMPPQKGQVLF